MSTLCCNQLTCCSGHHTKCRWVGDSKKMAGEKRKVRFHCELACGHRPNFFFFNLTWYAIYRVGWLLKSLTGKFLLRYSTFWTRKRQFFTTKFKNNRQKIKTFFFVFFKKGPEVINYCAEVNGNIGRPLTCYFSLISWDSIPPKYWMVWYSDQQWGEFKEGQRK